MPKCEVKTKAGKPCKAPPLTGTKYCMAHAPAKVRESAGFIANNGKQGRPRLPSPIEIARKAVEENVLVILRPHFAALGYEPVIEDGEVALQPLDGGGAKLFGESKDGIVKMSEHEDLGAQMKAADGLLDRLYGKPRQAVELSGENGGPMEVVSITRKQASAVGDVIAKVTGKGG